MIDERETRFGVYVHWPFCAAKCPYCDFNSHVPHRAVDQPRFVRAFAAELSHFAERTAGRTVTSIFLGGGTPSLMAPETVDDVLSRIGALWTVADGAEITLEANPSSVEAERFRGYRTAGVNRVSLGVQALNDPDLKRLGRLHNVAEAKAAVEIARSTFPRLSFDLIYGRPEQTPDEWQGELEQAIAMAADHLSLYQLTIEPGTPFAALFQAGRLTMPDDDRQADFYEVTQSVTAAHGLPAYEISNHASPGAESRHNMTYWRYRDYVGVGPGAHGRLTIDGEKHATATELHPENWLKRVESDGHGLVTDDVLTLEEAADEMLLMGLRLDEGLEIGRYTEISGRPFDPERISALTTHGMIEVLDSQAAGGGRLRVTRAGSSVLDAVVADLAA